MRGNTGRVVTAMALVVVLALTGTSAFADGGGSEPQPVGASTYSEIDGALGFLDAVSSVLNLV